jgi:hypothetical protein
VAGVTDAALEYTADHFWTEWTPPAWQAQLSVSLHRLRGLTAAIMYIPLPSHLLHRLRMEGNMHLPLHVGHGPW